MGNVFINGFSVSIGLIMAIGAQNAYVLRLGLRREHVALVVLMSIACDAVMIYLGVLGVGRLLSSNPDWLALARYGGAIFLGWYGVISLRSVFRQQSLQVTADNGDAQKITRKQVILSAAAFSLLNPHAYLDTMVLLGSIGGQYQEHLRPLFTIGAIMASIVWFIALGFGARTLTPLFAKPLAWKVLDIIIVVMLWSIAIALLIGF